MESADLNTDSPLHENITFFRNKIAENSTVMMKFRILCRTLHLSH